MCPGLISVVYGSLLALYACIQERIRSTEERICAQIQRMGSDMIATQRALEEEVALVNEKREGLLKEIDKILKKHETDEVSNI